MNNKLLQAAHATTLHPSTPPLLHPSTLLTLHPSTWIPSNPHTLHPSPPHLHIYARTYRYKLYYRPVMRKGTIWGRW